MSNYKGHLFGGVCVYLTVIYIVSSSSFFPSYPSLSLALEWLLFTLAGSLFPDIDVKSKGQNYFYWLVFGLLIFLFFKKKWKLMAFVGLIAIIPQLVRHRGIFHRVWFIILLPTTLSLILYLYVPHYKNNIFFDTIFFIAGALSHVWLDLGWRGMFRR